MDKCRNKNKTCHTGWLHHIPARQLWYRTLIVCRTGRETNSPSNCLNMKLRIKPSLLSSLKLILLYTKVQKKSLFSQPSLRSCWGRQNCFSERCFATRSPADQKFWSLLTPLDLPATMSPETGANLYPAKHKKNNRKINPTLRQRTHGSGDWLS